MTHPTVFRVALRGDELLNNPRFNKGTAFTVAERKEFGLTGRLPYKVNTLDEQCERAYLQLQGRDSAIRYAGLGLSKCRPCLNDHQQEFLPAEPEEPEHRLILHPSDEVRQMSAVFKNYLMTPSRRHLRELMYVLFVDPICHSLRPTPQTDYLYADGGTIISREIFS